MHETTSREVSGGLLGDQAGSEAKEYIMDVVASLPADAWPAKAVQPGDGAFDDPAEGAQAGAVGWPPFGDHSGGCLTARADAGTCSWS